MEYKKEEISILVVDNEEKARSLIKDLLEIKGFKRIWEAASINEAVETAKREKHFDVILADMVMDNEEDGLKIIEQYRGLSSLLIIITGHPDPEMLKKCMRFGAYDYIEKDKKNTREQIIQSIQEGLKNNPYQGLSIDRDSLYIGEKFDEWAIKYPGKYVAVLDLNLVKVGDNYSQLKEEMEKEYPLAEVSIMSIPDNEEVYIG